MNTPGILPADRALKIAVGLVSAVLIAAALSQARTVFEPLALAFFIIAIVWPLQHWLQVRIPKLLALGVTIIVTVSVCLAFASVLVWGFGRVSRSLVTDLARRPRGLSCRLMGRAFQRWVAAACLTAGNRPPQHHLSLLADHAALRRPWTIGGRRHAAEGR